MFTDAATTVEPSMHITVCNLFCGADNKLDCNATDARLQRQMSYELIVNETRHAMIAWKADVNTDVGHECIALWRAELVSF